MKIMLLSPSGAFAAAMESLADGESTYSTVLVAAHAVDLPTDATLIRLGDTALAPEGRLLKALDRTMIGRNIKRLPPLDGGHRFAARARRSHEFRSAAAEADLIVALERDAVLAAWTALRSWSKPHARGVFGLAPARAVLAALRAAQEQ
ncbi:hypothetical protein ACU045_13895 [Microbacterium sp. MAHUQ-60]|uniref:hypothetical protein n=1 Tax=unclassified Microbacterium TaxID=2609290 RepID=UPI00361F52D0